MLRLCFQVIVFIVFTFSKSGLVHAQECSSIDIPEDEWKWGITALSIDANHTGIIIEYRMGNTISIATSNIGFNQKYIDARLENNVLIIFTTPAFENYEDQETEIVIQLQIDLVCTSGVSNIVFIQPITVKNNHLPVFTEATYNITVKLPLPKGFDLTYYQEISARDIDLRFNRVTFDSPSSGLIEVGTSATIGSDQKTFFATLVLTQQLLTLQEPFNFTIIATDSDIEYPRKSSALVHIIPDIEVTYVPIPRFEKVFYRGNIDDDGVLLIDDPTIEMDTYSEDLSFELIGDDSDLFVLGFPTIFSVNVSLKAPLTQENLSGKTILTATVTANHPEVASGSSVIVIDLPTEQPTTTPKPTFEKSLIRGSINAELELVIDNVVLIESSYSPEIIFTLSGDDSSTFNITNELNVVSITLNESLSEEELESRDFYSFIIVATHPTSGTAETAVLISVPKKICEACPECPEPTDCPECPTTPEPTECPECPTTEPPSPVDMSPIFQNQFYSFAIKSNEFGSIGEVFAKSPNPDVTINYEISTENGYLVTRLSIDSSTGEISIREELNSGYYEADVIAKTTINDEELQGRTTLKITVIAATICSDGNVTVSKSLAIEYLKENEIHRNIFPTKIDECHYVIRSIEPNDKEYVSINSNTNMLESISFDREDIIFNDYEVPQIQIKLKLNCGDVPAAVSQFNQNRQFVNSTRLQLPRTIDPSIGDGRWYTLMNDIDFTSDLTVINIIIQDVNDNDPIFDPLTPTLIGYPEPIVANNVIPSYLAIIRATDKDAGINAKIKYTLLENNHFKIHPESGMISPLSDGLSSSVDSVQLTIYATDNYGAENGRSALHVLSVKRLEQKHLTIVTMRDVEINSSDDVIEQLNSESSIKMMVLHSAIVPYLSTNSRQSQDGAVSVLKMIVYAFGNNGEPLVTSQVQRALEPFMASRQLTFTSYEEDYPSNDGFIEDNIMWIIVVSVLGVIILLAVGTIFSMWWFKIRPYEYKTMIDETSVSQENLRDDSQDFKVETSPPTTRVDIGNGKRESVNISGSTEMESTDDLGKIEKSLLNLLESDDLSENNINEESEKRERRKSQGVTFNELVERIDIETDPTRDSDIDLRR